jgi:predicted TIM-barrel fold metal-dependent hydrolase
MKVPLVDTNVYVGRWPWRRVPLDDAGALVAKLKSRDVAQAWTGSFEGLFHRDLRGANERLAETCRAAGEGLLVPFGSINPALPDWEEDLRRCHEELQMPGVRLHPNYHGYKLDEEPAGRVLSAAAERGLVVQLVVSMEDERTQNGVFRVPHVDCAPLAKLVEERPKLKLVVLNAFRALGVKEAEAPAAAGNVAFDIAMLEGVGGVARLVDRIGLEHVVFGSHAPLFYFESAVMKLGESELAGFQIEAIARGNAGRMLPVTS